MTEPEPEHGFFKKNARIFWLVFSIIALITIFPLFTTGFATADDLYYYLITRGGNVYNEVSFFARSSGRFYLYFVRPLYSLPYLADSMVFTKVLLLVPLLVSFWLFSRIIRKITGSPGIAWLFLLLVFVTMQVSQHTSLFVAYPFYFSFSFILLLCSFWLLLRYLEERKSRLLWGSVALFAAGLLFYESYIFYLVFAAAAIAGRMINGEGNRKERILTAFLRFLPYMITGILYLAAYFAYRRYYPPSYSGTTFASGSVTPITFLKVLHRLSLTSFPLTVFNTSMVVFQDRQGFSGGFSDILRLFMVAKVEWLVKAILVAFCGYRILAVIRGVKTRKMLVITIMAIMMIYLPHIPLALTEKYTHYVIRGGMLGYVTTFFSFFGTVLLLTTWISWLADRIGARPWIRKTFAGIMVFFFFLCSVITDYSNTLISEDIRRANLRFYALDDLLKTDEFKKVPARTPFYGPTLWNNPSLSAATLTEQGFNWSRYFLVRTGHYYPVGREDKIFLEYSKRVPQTPWYIAARQSAKTDDVVLMLAGMKPLKKSDFEVDHFADRATVLYYSSYKVFSVSFRIKDLRDSADVPVMINNRQIMIPPGGTTELNIFCTRKYQRSTVFTITAPGIDLKSIMISNMVNRKNPYFYL